MNGFLNKSQDCYDLSYVPNNADLRHVYLLGQPFTNKTANELAAAIETIKSQIQQHYVTAQQAYTVFDRNGRDCITRARLHDLLANLKVRLPEATLKELLMLLDPQHSNVISKHVFMKAFNTPESPPSVRHDEEQEQQQEQDQVFGSSKEQEYKASTPGEFAWEEDEQYKEHRNMESNLYKELTNQTVRPARVPSSRSQQREPSPQPLNENLQANMWRKLQYKLGTDFDSVMTSFRRYDLKCKGVLSVSDVQRILQNLGFLWSVEQFIALLNKLRMPIVDGQVNYEQALAALRDGHGPQTRVLNSQLTPMQAEQKLKKQIRENLRNVTLIFKAFDRGWIGKIRMSDFRRALETFCFKLTDAQYNYLIHGRSKNGYVDYSKFINDMIEEETKAKQTKQKGLAHELKIFVKRMVAKKYAKLDEALQKCDYAGIGVVCKPDFKRILRENGLSFTEREFAAFWKILPVNSFGNLDYREFLKTHIDEELTSTVNVPLNNEPRLAARPRTGSHGVKPMSRTVPSTAVTNGRDHFLDNTDLLSNKMRAIEVQETTKTYRMQEPMSADMWGHPVGARMFRPASVKEKPQHRPKTAPAAIVEENYRRRSAMTTPDGASGDQEARMPPLASRSLSITAVPDEPLMVDQEAVDVLNGKLRNVACRRWKAIYRSCRGQDSFNHGDVDLLKFSVIMREYNVEGAVNTWRHLLEQYGVLQDHRVRYADLLRQLVLHLKFKEPPSTKRLNILHNRMSADSGDGGGVANTQYSQAMLRIYDRVVENWKLIRRKCLMVDSMNTGQLRAHPFRCILAQFGVRMSDDDFFHVMSYYDRQLSGLLNYNDFLRAFLR